MRVRVARDGKGWSVDVVDPPTEVTIDGHRYPVKVVRQERDRVELEIAGEPVVIDGWSAGRPVPGGPVDVNGERWTFTVEVEAETVAAPLSPGSSGPSIRASVPAPPTSGSAPGELAILPPMPGKIVEVRVRAGEAVEAGQILLVLEAMKMRNELTAPRAGVVRVIHVAPGANVRAKEPLLILGPP